MTELSNFRRIAAADSYLCIVATARADSSMQASLVTAGVMVDPRSGDEVVAFVAAGGARKLVNLRARPWATVVARSGWQWEAVEGKTELIGPDDPAAGFDAERLRTLLREVFVAAGGTHDDWDAYDAAMVNERRVVVFVRPARAYSNG
ncbi:MAG TPA: pyridoxamine 5'-phosphate oxidase family protein [Acidimicrobiia bacterium]|nr:pyridoxamine 5'-phosphate oxidase family protein [Acidimicrobiia bacterium]